MELGNNWSGKAMTSGHNAHDLDSTPRQSTARKKPLNQLDNAVVTMNSKLRLHKSRSWDCLSTDDNSSEFSHSYDGDMAQMACRGELGSYHKFKL